MASTFLGLEIAKRGLGTHQVALQTTGHNISNADNKNYARQRVSMESMDPLYNPSLNRAQGPGMLGQGSMVQSVERVRDLFLDEKVRSSEQSKSYWEARQKYLHQTEVIFNEPSEESMRAQLDRFWQSWQDLSHFPEELSYRETVRSRGKELTFSMRETFHRLFDLRQNVDFEITVGVDSMNSMATQIRDLNERILKSRNIGDSPNDLMDRRDALLQQLAQYADVTIENQDSDELIVYLGGEMLVQGETVHLLKSVGDGANEGLHRVVWEHNGKDALFRNGKMQALLEIRDDVLKENIEKLDLLAINISDVTNEVHRDGFGLGKETNVNFFHIENLSRNLKGNFDLNGDGSDDTTAVFKVAGKNKINADRPLGISGTITLYKNDISNTPIHINYRADETLENVIQRINSSESGVVAYLNHDDNLVLKARLSEKNDTWQKNLMIRHLEDSGELLVGYTGILQNSSTSGAFDYRRVDEINRFQSNIDRITLTPVFHPAGSMDLSREIQDNVSLIAAATGKDIGGTGDKNQGYGAKDGENALRIAQALRHKKTMVGRYENSDQFYNSLVAKLGIESRTSQDQVENQTMVLNNFENLRQSVMGVNLDEEMANMVQFQHGYNAAAKVINMMDEMLDRIINRLF